jgi:hypothetical protein
LFGTMTMLDLIYQQWPLKQFKNWNSSFSPTQHTVKISPNLTAIFSVCSKIHYMDANVQMMYKSRMQCICGLCTTKKILHICYQETQGLK